MTVLVVGVEPPQQAEVLDLLRQSDAYSASLYPVEGRRPLGVEALSAQRSLPCRTAGWGCRGLLRPD